MQVLLLARLSHLSETGTEAKEAKRVTLPAPEKCLTILIIEEEIVVLLGMDPLFFFIEVDSVCTENIATKKRRRIFFWGSVW